MRHKLGLLPSPLWGGVGGGGPSADHRTTPTRLASLATLPTRGRVAPSLLLALNQLHLNALNHQHAVRRRGGVKLGEEIAAAGEHGALVDRAFVGHFTGVERGRLGE